MTSIFSRIISGEFPGRFVWRDETCVAFLTIAPMAPGHTLVVPIEEIDHWLDLPDELADHLFLVSRLIGRAQRSAFEPSRVGVLIAGEEVPHTHIHLIPFSNVSQLDLLNADHHPNPADLDAAANKLRVALRANGHPEVED